MPRIVLVTGMAGAGRTTALRALEDVGFEAVDNPPIDLLGSLLRPTDETRRPLAIGIDCRAHAFDSQGLNRRLDDVLRESDDRLRVLFLDCEEEIPSHAARTNGMARTARAQSSSVTMRFT